MEQTRVARAPEVKKARRRWHPRPASMQLLRGLGGILILGAIIEVVSRLGLVNPEFLPPFSVIILQTLELLTNSDFQEDIVSTLAGWAIGLGVSIVIGVTAGLFLGLSSLAFRMTRGLIEFIRPMPAVALIPLAIVVMGQGLVMKVSITAFAAVWPILFNTIYGVRSTVPLAKEMARVFGHSRLGVILRIVLPSAAPFIMTGVRISSSIALILVITVEMLAGASSGIGAFIANVRAIGLEPSLAYAGVLVAGVLGVLINSLLSVIDRRAFGWQFQK